MSQAFDLSQIVLSAVLAIWSAALLITLIIKICIGSNVVKKAILIPALLALLCLFLVSVTDTIGYTYNWDIDKYPSLSLLMLAKVSFWTIQFITRYIFLTSLLYYSFKGSAYQISVKFLICHSIVIIKVFLIGLSMAIFLSSKTDPQIALITSIVWVFNTMLYIIGLCHLTWTINKKLFKLILMNADNNKQIHHMDHSKPDEISSSNQAQLSLLKTSTKLSVLQVIYTISTVSYVIIAVFCRMTTDNKLYEFIDFVAYWWSGIIRSLVLFLTFQVNDGSYKCLCKWCDHKCFRLYQYCADAKRLRRSRSMPNIQITRRDGHGHETVLSKSTTSTTKFTRNISSAETGSSYIASQPTFNTQSTVTVTIEQSDAVNVNLKTHMNINVVTSLRAPRSVTATPIEPTCTIPNQLSSDMPLPTSAMTTPVTDVDDDGEGMGMEMGTDNNGDIEDSVHSPLCLEDYHSTQL